MIIKLLTEHHLEFLSLKGGCRGSSESTLVKMSNCWKSHARALIFYLLSLFTHCICAKSRDRTLKEYVEDKCCVKYQTAHRTRKKLIFTIGLTTNFDACMPNVVGTY